MSDRPERVTPSEATRLPAYAIQELWLSERLRQPLAVDANIAIRSAKMTLYHCDFDCCALTGFAQAIGQRVQ
jgi:hypothetical protein